MNEIEQQLSVMSESERQNWLEDNASKVEPNSTYVRTLTAEEVRTSKEVYSEKAIVLDAKVEAFTEIKKEFTNETNDIKSEMKTELKKFKNGVEEMKGTLYFMDDQHNSLMYVYDQFGNQIECRPLRPHEKQKTIFSINKTGTNDGN